MDKRENYVTRNVNELECAVVSWWQNCISTFRVQSAKFEKMRSIYCINMRALQCCKQWNVSICEKCQREMARPWTPIEGECLRGIPLADYCPHHMCFSTYLEQQTGSFGILANLIMSPIINDGCQDSKKEGVEA